MINQAQPHLNGGYPILRFDELPEIDIQLMEYPNEPPMGAGESSSVPSAAAVANALFDALGVRMREAPFTPERILRAVNMAAKNQGVAHE